MAHGRLATLFTALTALAALHGLASATEVTDFAIYGDGNVKVSGSVTGDVGSGDGALSVGSKSRVFGDVVSEGAMGVASKSIVQGDATAGGAIKLKGSVTGTVTPLAGPATLGPLLPSGLLPVTSFTSGGTSYKGKVGTLDLAPGTYGSVNIKGAKGKGELELSAGNYYFSSFALKGMTLYVDLSGGAVNIYVNGNVQVSKSGMTTPDMTAAGADASGDDSRDPAGQIYLETHGKATLTGSEWLGTVYAPDGSLVFGNGSIDGALYGGGDVSLTGKVSLTYGPLYTGDPDDPPGGGGDDPPGGGGDDPPGGGGDGGVGLDPIPEPGTMALLGTSLLGLMAQAFSRRKRSA